MGYQCNTDHAIKLYQEYSTNHMACLPTDRPLWAGWYTFAIGSLLLPYYTPKYPKPGSYAMDLCHITNHGEKSGQ